MAPYQFFNDKLKKLIVTFFVDRGRKRDQLRKAQSVPHSEDLIFKKAKLEAEKLMVTYNQRFKGNSQKNSGLQKMMEKRNSVGAVYSQPNSFRLTKALLPIGEMDEEPTTKEEVFEELFSFIRQVFRSFPSTFSLNFLNRTNLKNAMN